MATTTSPATTAATTVATTGDTPAYFRRLLAQRALFGQLAESQRSHHGQDISTDPLDAVVNLLTDELESRFPDLWAPLEADLLVTELGLLHDPTEGPMLGCGICHEQHQAQRRRTQSSKQPRHSRQHGRTSTSAAAAPRRQEVA